MADRDLLERIDAHMARGNELMQEIREEHELNREQHELNRRTLMEIQRGCRQEAANSRAVTRDLIAEIRTIREQGRRHNDAVVGALSDLAAEIRSWGGGAAPA